MDAKVPKPIVRIAAVQQQVWAVPSRDAFLGQIDLYIRSASEAGCDFILFPELFTLPLLTINERIPASEAAGVLSEHTEPLRKQFKAWAQQYRINVIAGSHLCLDAARTVRNISFVALRDGRIFAREKLHPTPDEIAEWGVVGGRAADIVETDCGPIGVLICYDSEFPEVGRHLVEQGARIIFVPYCTESRHGHLRVRYSCQARAVENQIYVVTAGLTGLVGGVANFDCNYAQSAIFTPCDYPFARDGIAAEATENSDMLVIADVDMTALETARAKGSVRNLNDRRLDLYRTEWLGD